MEAAKHGKVIVITKTKAEECNTRYAQGGIACVIDKNDTFEAHISDTLTAGAGLCHPDAVRDIVTGGPARVRELESLGLKFTTMGEVHADVSPDKANELDLGREGGHSARRVVHAGDITGSQVSDVLLARCRENKNITILENHLAVDLISTRHIEWQGENRCLGAYVMDTKTNEIKTFLSRFTFLATGGAGKVYLCTCNPDVACGDGIAMAYRASAEISNMEFYQFHPTILYHPTIRSFLISEALRGEGAVLKCREKRGGEPREFMQKFHAMQSLAPRDVVARAIDSEMKRTGEECVYLDIRHLDEETLRRRFPNIFAKCLEAGVNMARDLIPVVPAAHFVCGGIKTDINGATSIDGLYAAGECACTGLHGANRLASNSLLEAMVIPRKVAADIERNFERLRDIRPDRHAAMNWTTGNATDSDEQVLITHNWDEIRRFMWDYVGIYRTNKRLERAKNRIKLIRKEIEKYYWDFIVTADLIELRNIATVAELIIDSALRRKESRGSHYNADYPFLDPDLECVDTVIQRDVRRL